MRLRNRVALQFVIFVLVLAAGPATVWAMDHEFDRVVRHIESRYNARRTRIPFLGLANVFVKAAKPGGVKEFKLAVFEDQDFSVLPDITGFDADIETSLGPDWRPLVRIFSRHQGEWTRIYAREAGNDVKLLVVTIEPREATVVQVKIEPELLMKWLNHPDRMVDRCKGAPVAGAEH